MTVNDTQKLLCFIYKNAEMGVRTLPQMIGKARRDDDTSTIGHEGAPQEVSSELESSVECRPEFLASLHGRLDRYNEICTEAEELLRREDPNADFAKLGQSYLEKKMVDSMLYMNTLRDTTCSHLSDMLLKGSSMGVTDIAKQIKKHPAASAEAVRLAEKLMKVEQDGIEEMKKYLTAV